MIRKWTPKPSLPPPVLEGGVWGWIYRNLFSSPVNTLLTAIGAAFLIWIIPPFIRWALLDATWVGNSRAACDKVAQSGAVGACWVFIKVRIGLFLYGFYPETERWRVNLTILVLALALLPILAPTFFSSTRRQVGLGITGGIVAGLLFGGAAAAFVFFFLLLPLALSGVSFKGRLFPALTDRFAGLLLNTAVSAVFGLLVYFSLRTAGAAAAPVAVLSCLLTLPLLLSKGFAVLAWRWLFLFSVYPVFAFFMLIGGVGGLSHVETHYWGGLFLTLVVAGTGMATALPIGVFLALGRRSEMPVIRIVCVTFIEFVRGVPLVSVLFMASVMFPLFLPAGMQFDKLLRALVGISFFYAAYMAEVLRGGLQAIPRGQYEAAQALGWSYWKMMWLIILPQTLRIVIPGLANNFLSLMKDTTLVAVIGLLDLLGIAKAAMADVEWLGFTKEAYVFAAVVFWTFCFGLSRYSIYLEKKYYSHYR